MRKPDRRRGRPSNPYRARQSMELYRRWINEIKTAPCMDCGNAFDPVCMEFDHRDPSTKHRSDHQRAFNRQWSWERIRAEIAKCDLVCSNCHRLRTKHRTIQARKVADVQMEIGWRQ